MNSSRSPSTGRRRFLVGVAILAVMALGMRPSARAVAQWSSKRPVYVRKPLREFDKSKLVGFQFAEDVGKNSAKDVETNEYIEWRLIPTDPRYQRTVVAYLLVHYYTEKGATPKIPHTPEVCYRQNGNQVTAIGGLDISSPVLAAEGLDIPAKYVRMSNPEQKENKDICAVYTLIHNGRFSSDREAARISMAMPWNRATYFAKIECVTRVPSPDALDEALETCKALMGCVIPELLASHFPTTADVARVEADDSGSSTGSAGGDAAAKND